MTTLKRPYITVTVKNRCCARNHTGHTHINKFPRAQTPIINRTSVAVTGSVTSNILLIRDLIHKYGNETFQYSHSTCKYFKYRFQSNYLEGM